MKRFRHESYAIVNQSIRIVGSIVLGLVYGVVSKPGLRQPIQQHILITIFLFKILLKAH